MTKLSRRRLEWLVRARGTDLAAWPNAERLAALALLRSSPDAQQVFADALVAEAAPENQYPENQYPENEHPENDCVIIERMQAALRRSLAPLPLLLRGLRAGALAACVGAGIYLATIQPEPDPTTDVFTSAQTLSLAALDQ